MEILTPKQKMLLKIAKEKGSINLRDIRSIYSNEHYSRKIIRRLVELGFLHKIFLSKSWMYTGKEI